jgi:hypothetical protein
MEWTYLFRNSHLHGEVMEWTTAFDLWDGETITHIVLCDDHSRELESELIYAMSHPKECESIAHIELDRKTRPEEFCDWCDQRKTLINRCSVCGGEGEHDWEVHVAELRAGSYEA